VALSLKSPIKPAGVTNWQTTSWSDPSSIPRARICPRISSTDPWPRWLDDSDHLMISNSQFIFYCTENRYGREKLYAVQLLICIQAIRVTSFLNRLQNPYIIRIWSTLSSFKHASLEKKTFSKKDIFLHL
jgi:hypothetical protein